MRNPKSISLFHIEFNGRNGVFGLPNPVVKEYFAYSDGGAFNSSICKNKNPDLKTFCYFLVLFIYFFYFILFSLVLESMTIT